MSDLWRRSAILAALTQRLLLNKPTNFSFYYRTNQLSPTVRFMSAVNGRPNRVESVELRVHGMGAKRPLDSIGSGPIVAWRHPRGPDTVQPPLLPDHQLRLLNWSRTSRRLASGAFWFAALPYSLINVAGQTADAKTRVAKDAATVTLVGVVHIVGLVVTLSGLFWSLFIAKTVLVSFSFGDVPGLNLWVLSATVVLFVAVIVVRTVYLLRKGDTKLDARGPCSRASMSWSRPCSAQPW